MSMWHYMSLEPSSPIIYCEGLDAQDVVVLQQRGSLNAWRWKSSPVVPLLRDMSGLIN